MHIYVYAKCFSIISASGGWNFRRDAVSDSSASLARIAGYKAPSSCSNRES